jgi:hypothetical protein
MMQNKEACSMDQHIEYQHGEKAGDSDDRFHQTP